MLVTFGLLSRSSELSVMKACGISLYRIAAPLLILSVAWSGILFALEQRLLARANEQVERIDSQIRGRAPRTSSPLTRTWLIGRDGAIYHYTDYDPQTKALQNLAVYRPANTGWQPESQLFAPPAIFSGSAWLGAGGWQQDFTGRRRRTAFSQRTLPSRPITSRHSSRSPMMTVPSCGASSRNRPPAAPIVVPLTIDLQKKLAFPLVTVVMTLLAIPFGMTTASAERSTASASIVMALSYWVVGDVFAAIGKAGMLHPIMAGWAPISWRPAVPLSPAYRADVEDVDPGRFPRAPSSGSLASSP